MVKENSKLIKEINGLKIQRFENLSDICPKTNNQIGGKNWKKCSCFYLKPRIKIPENKKAIFRLKKREFNYEKCENAYPIVMNGQEIIGCACTYNSSNKK